MNLMNDVVMREGVRGKARLSLAAGRVEKMIDRYRTGECNPPPNVAREIALACGCGAEEADALARECSSGAKTA